MHHLLCPHKPCCMIFILMYLPQERHLGGRHRTLCFHLAIPSNSSPTSYNYQKQRTRSLQGVDDKYAKLSKFGIKRGVEEEKQFGRMKKKCQKQTQNTPKTTQRGRNTMNTIIIGLIHTACGELSTINSIQLHEGSSPSFGL